MPSITPFCLTLLTSLSLSYATTTTKCPNPASIPSIGALANQFPKNWQTASIVPGDTVAQSLWASIQSNLTYANALAMAPHKMKGENPDFTGYSTTGTFDLLRSKGKC